MPKYGFLVVEGPHDVEFVYRLLRPFGLQRIRQEPGLDRFLEPLIPRKYPPDGDLQKRMPTPLFLQSPTHALAIHSATGDSRLVETVQENLAVLDLGRLTGVGILLDADRDKTVSAAERYADIQGRMNGIGVPLSGAAGAVTDAGPKRGCFVLPDNAADGTLEDILLECAQAVYATMLAGASTHVDAAMNDTALRAEDLEHIQKPSGRQKAIVGSIASILRPGKATQVSLQDNRWLRGPTLQLPRVKAVQGFLATLFELTALSLRGSSP
jgi:hypothetical protein